LPALAITAATICSHVLRSGFAMHGLQRYTVMVLDLRRGVAPRVDALKLIAIGVRSLLPHPHCCFLIPLLGMEFISFLSLLALFQVPDVPDDLFRRRAVSGENLTLNDHAKIRQVRGGFSYLIDVLRPHRGIVCKLLGFVEERQDCMCQIVTLIHVVRLVARFALDRFRFHCGIHHRSKFEHILPKKIFCRHLFRAGGADC
jgi:hypothetical protein